MKKSIIGIAVIIVIIIISIISILLIINKQENTELKSIKTEKELEKIYEEEEIGQASELLINILTMPFSFFANDWYYGYDAIKGVGSTMTEDAILNGENLDLKVDSNVSSTNTESSSKDYSKTNIQVENVDEADITKTDGDYIYSISDNNVIITNVIDPNNIKISSKINISDGTPEDLILYKDKLVIISTDVTLSSSYYYSKNSNTIVKIYDISNKEKPNLVKKYKLLEPYYTSRCIDSKLYVISSGSLKKENNKIVTYYNEDNVKKQIEMENIKYLKDIKTKNQTIISMLDLNNPTEKVNINSYLIDISNAYVSENNIYLLDYYYNSNNSEIPIRTLFGFKGAFGPFLYEDEHEYNYEYKTKIYKFNILQDGTIKYDTKTEIEGQTINQFSIDEYNGNLRVALYDYNGSRVVIFNDKLDKIGETSYLAKGEKMYSSRFIGEKAYLVTYRTIDPLYVIDVSNPTKPTVLGELKIPGYSTYLHPYDENHLIGIGMETKETINRNLSGKVISTTAKIVGMKMALFDVSDINNPIQISSTVIGDSRATSAILTNHKALLFSKEKELIAIPVNNYQEDFEITNSSDTYSSIINSFVNYSKNYISEGYFVYKINLEDGFNLKGIINHEKSANMYYYNNSKLLRGLYIDDNLYTISEDKIKVNRLDNLEQISELKIR